MKWCIPIAVMMLTTASFGDDAFSYDAYAKVLETYVDDEGLVDYAGLKADRSGLDAFIDSMGAVDPSDFAGWSDAAKIAFWTNAYNAITLEYIIDHYPIEPGGIISRIRFPNNSIRQIDGVWDELKTRVVGRALTLDHIEHEILRKEFDEPRIHMALVCAAMSCPKLRNEPYTGEALDAQLEDQSRHFCTSSGRVRIDRSEDRLYLSAIFDWFGGDFKSKYTPSSGFDHLGGAEKAVANFVSQHVSEADAAYLRTQEYSVRYLDYDWSLNER